MKKNTEVVALTGDLAIQAEVVAGKQQIALINKALLKPEETYDIAVCVANLRSIRDDVALRVYEMGRLLLLIRNNETPAAYRSALEHAGIADRFASRACATFKKFNGGKRVELLEKLGISKVLELMSEADDDLDALADGGSIAGHNVDEFANLTLREVKEALVKSRAEIAEQREVTDSLISARDERIAKIERQLHLGDKYPGADKANDYLADAQRAAAQIVAASKTLIGCADRFSKLQNDVELPKETQDMMRACVAFAHDATVELRDFLAVEVEQTTVLQGVKFGIAPSSKAAN